MPQLRQLEPVAGNIVLLDLARTHITDAGLQSLAKMPNLTRLEIQETNTGDAGLQWIGNLPALEVLNLYDTHVTDKGLARLASLKKLRRVYLWRTSVTDAGVQALRKRMPQLDIVRRPSRIPRRCRDDPSPARNRSPVHSRGPAGQSPGTAFSALRGKRQPPAPAKPPPRRRSGAPRPKHRMKRRSSHCDLRPGSPFRSRRRAAALLLHLLQSLGHGRRTAAASAALDASLPAKITFNEHIQPILSENCYFCHGQDATARKADLRVDREEFAFLPRKSGLPAIVKGHPEIQRPHPAHLFHRSQPGDAAAQLPQGAADSATRSPSSPAG